MGTKLTLTVEEHVIRRAKSYAKESGRSLSELIENYLSSLTEPTVAEGTLSPKLSKLVGVVKLPENFDEEQELREYFENKHR